ncbi:hypothetical protein [Salipiger sp. PrR003]|uniref:hypothetical protein n=1 Tax=Salipiger sp. PrR003 TaxID=2706776 RepID=UPI0013DA3B14|nr:hypothetical protein [Salipiger sp. PrR003]NDV50382.1 hypothetical protein [Salipiger sp. PrR003]
MTDKALTPSSGTVDLAPVGTSILPALTFRPLEWHQDDTRSFGTLVSRTPVGEFVIRRSFIDQTTYLDTPVPSLVAPIACGGVEDAMDKAVEVLRQLIGYFLIDDVVREEEADV